MFWWVGLLVIILSCPAAKLPAVKREGCWRCPGVSNTGPKADPQLADVSKTSQNPVFSSLPRGWWWGWTTQGWIFSCCCPGGSAPETSVTMKRWWGFCFSRSFCAGVQSAAVNVICELARRNPKNYLSLAPLFFKLMTSSTNNWVLIKIIKLASILALCSQDLGSC